VTRRPGRALPLLIVLALASACGSTVEVSGRSQQDLGIGGSLVSPPATEMGDGTTPQAGAPGVSVPAGGAGSVPAAGDAGGPISPSAAPVVGPTFAVSGPGVTDKEIFIGVVHAQNGGAINQAAGVGSITTGDSLANTRAVIDDINKHGGVAGRKLVMVTAEFDATSTQSVETQWSAVCQTFTRDHHVFAVLDTGTEAFHECIGKAGAVVLSDNLAGYGDEEYRRHPGYIEQGFPSVDRLARYMTVALGEQHYFTPWNSTTGTAAATGAVKVGILTYDDRHYTHAVDTYLVPALKKLGYAPLVARIGGVSTASDYGPQAAAVKSAQLSFAANGVTHVISFESNGGLSTFFLPNARSQHYYPRYGVNTASGTEALMEAGIVDAQQLNGTVGFGWTPAVDLRAADYPESSPYSDPGRKHCKQVMRDHGITPSSGNAEAVEFIPCAGLYLLQRVLNGVDRITMSTFITRLEGLGSSYRAAGSLGERFGPGHHDGVSGTYHWHWVTGCTCMRYEGPLRAIP